jgi:hypothetical protein
MTCVETNVGRVRVWREANVFGERPGDDLEEVLAETSWKSMKDVAARIEDYAGVAAYEVVDADGNGWVVYPDWK